jgi:hypothetical protein
MLAVARIKIEFGGFKDGKSIGLKSNLWAVEMKKQLIR